CSSSSSRKWPKFRSCGLMRKPQRRLRPEAAVAAGPEAAADSASTAALPDPDWRTGHCAEPAVERLKQATGRDLWAELGGVPRSPRAAAAFYRRLGVTCLADAVTAILGDPVDPKLAMRGDVALVDDALGIV